MVRNEMGSAKGESTPWVFGRVPNGYWDKAENRRKFCAWLGREYGLEKPSDWYQICQQDFRVKWGGGILANCYHDSPYAAIKDFNPEYDWKPWLFRRAPQRFWRKLANRRLYMDWLGEKLGFTQNSDWYQVTKKDFYAHGGGGLLANYYNDSPLAALQDYRPRCVWKAWLFKSTPNGFWHVAENRRAYMDWLGQRLKLSTPEDWHGLRVVDFRQNAGAGLLIGYYDSSPRRAIAEYLEGTTPPIPSRFAKPPRGRNAGDRSRRHRGV